ncbi:hypothetical protein [uncultured Hymenobacter sp.]|uniref:hypothetical protein n=1 Tax=uncultured Hymenobacter sp. TaxID=170016 RepID=UPI0035CBDD7D
MSAFVSATDTFTIAYDAQRELLRACWLQPLADEELQATLLELLTAAQRYANCRYWLLDARRRPIAGPALRRWARQVLHPQLYPALGGPVFVAFVVTPGQWPAIENVAMDQHLRAAAAEEVFPNYFEDEPTALNWLRDQQKHD